MNWLVKNKINKPVGFLAAMDKLVLTSRLLPKCCLVEKLQVQGCLHGGNTLQNMIASHAHVGEQFLRVLSCSFMATVWGLKTPTTIVKLL